MEEQHLWQLDLEGILDLNPHEGQSRAWSSTKRFVWVLAGTQAGKTSFGPWWLWREIQRCGQGDYLAVTASYDLFKLKMGPELRMVFENILGIGRWWAGDRVIELRDPETGMFWAKRADDPMWGRIILRSANSPGGLESATAKAAWLDECGQDSFILESWEAVQRRLSLSQGRVLGTTTLYNLGWLKYEIFDPWEAGEDGGLNDVIQFPSYVNPAFPKAEYERMEDTMQDWRFSMFYKGEFAKPAGLIYKDMEAHMWIDPFPIPKSWPRVLGVDFGGANVARVWGAINPRNGRLVVYRATLDGEKTTSQHCQEELNYIGEGGFTWRAVGGAPGESQQRRDWTDAGLMVRQPTISDVESGIDRVVELIKTDRFRVFNTLSGIRDEIGSYRRKLDDAGNPTDVILNKRAYHRLDGIRYLVTAIGTGVGVWDPAFV